jgi:hypothetical protein
VVLDKKDRDEYVQKRDMVATKMTPAHIVETQAGSSCLRKRPKLPLSHLLLSRASADYSRSSEPNNRSIIFVCRADHVNTFKGALDAKKILASARCRDWTEGA